MDHRVAIYISVLMIALILVGFIGQAYQDAKNKNSEN